MLSARSLHVLKVDKMLKGLQLSAAVLLVYMDIKSGVDKLLTHMKMWDCKLLTSREVHIVKVPAAFRGRCRVDLHNGILV